MSEGREWDEADTPHHNAALASVSRALWDIVTPELRGVAYAVTGTNLRVRFLYANEMSEEEYELVSEAETESMADYLPPFEVEFVAEHVPISERREPRSDEHWVYLRRETRD